VAEHVDLRSRFLPTCIPIPDASLHERNPRPIPRQLRSEKHKRPLPPIRTRVKARRQEQLIACEIQIPITCDTHYIDVSIRTAAQ
jgi:hypothetical protein